MSFIPLTLPYLLSLSLSLSLSLAATGRRYIQMQLCNYKQKENWKYGENQPQTYLAVFLGEKKYNKFCYKNTLFFAPILNAI